jgi:hypothetical protein
MLISSFTTIPSAEYSQVFYIKGWIIRWWIEMLVENQKVNVKWNRKYKKYYTDLGYVFTKDNDEFEVDIKHLLKGSKSLVKYACDGCGKIFERSYQLCSKKEKQFCSNKCSGNYYGLIRKIVNPIKKCLECGNEYQVLNFRYEESKFCSKTCSNKFSNRQRQISMKSKTIVNCDWCNKEISRANWRVIKNKNNFCNKKCQNNWFREYVKTDEFIDKNREVMLNNLKNGNISFTNSEPQLIINDLLTTKNLNYENEKIYWNYSIDLFLTDRDLLIEVNGSYWHCDNRFYQQIRNSTQLNKIIIDKKKRGYIKNKYNKNILYLWEFDIMTNLKLCELLIEEFINKNGELINYHSFNYYIDELGELKLENELIVPYMDLTVEELSDRLNTETRQNVTRYNPDKHIIFNCEQCGKETEHLKSKYIKSKHHFCSYDCMYKFKKGKPRKSAI